MKRSMLALMFLAAATAAFAQQPAAPGPDAAAAGRGGGRGGGKGGGPPAAAAPLPLLFKEAWKDGPGNVPMTQAGVTSPELVLNQYPGTKADDFGITAEGGVPHIWTGLCGSSCALTLSLKDSYMDLTGKAKIRWYTKVSGFHEVRPVLKLADGSFVIGNHVDAHMVDYQISDIYLSEVRWLKIDMKTVQGKGELLDKVDLSKVDAIGFADLTPGSGHGSGGYSDVGWMEVYGKPVKRDAPLK